MIYFIEESNEYSITHSIPIHSLKKNSNEAITTSVPYFSESDSYLSSMGVILTLSLNRENEKV